MVCQVGWLQNKGEVHTFLVFVTVKNVKQAVVVKHNKPRPRVAYRGIAQFLAIDQKRNQVVPWSIHLPWKFHATNQSSRFLVILLTKTKKDTYINKEIDRKQKNRCIFTKVIAKLKQGYHFLDHPVDRWPSSFVHQFVPYSVMGRSGTHFENGNGYPVGCKVSETGRVGPGILRSVHK